MIEIITPEGNIEKLDPSNIISTPEERIRSRTKKCLEIVQSNFNEQFIRLPKRNTSEQNIIGDLLTVLESNIKNQIKKLL